MKENKKQVQNLSNIAEILFPLLLLLLPLLKVNQGIDLTDTPYSLGNYRFFTGMEGVWVLATFLSNVTGFLFTKLPFGSTMIGMKVYSSLIISAMALLGYRFFKTKMPPLVAFLGEVAAIGFCWCPSVILYNYMTYFFFLLMGMLLFRGLAGNHRSCLFLAGSCLGWNVSVRVPNILEAALILCLWYYGIRKKKSFQKIFQETLLCLSGFLTAQLVMFLVISLCYGFGAYGEMIAGLFGMTEGASDYTFREMVLSILSAYWRGLQWMSYMLLCILPGIPFLVLWKGKYEKARKIVYCLCIAFLLLVLYKWGMYNFKYYQKESALQWGTVFLLLSLAMAVWTLFTKQIDAEWMLIGSIAGMTILITPLGSNNYVWPALNNLFFVAPVTLWIFYRFIRWGRTYLDTTGRVPLFSAKAMIAAMLLAFLVQSIGLLFGYVFLDGENGQKRKAGVTNNSVLAGMKTTEENAKELTSLSQFMEEKKEDFEGKKLILYGNIPGLSYYLDRESAIYTTWIDLDTNRLDRLAKELETQYAGELTGERRPLIILATDSEESDKLSLILSFMEEHKYTEVFHNAKFIVYS